MRRAAHARWAVRKRITSLGDAMGPRLILWSVLGVAAGFVSLQQPAMAGERRNVAAPIHHRAAFVQSVAVVAPARSTLRADLPKPIGYDAANRGVDFGARRTALVHGEFSFVPVTPLRQEVREQRPGVGSPQQGPRTTPRERKGITFFRLDPKLGDVSVQPVVGGVNGAQLSVGF